MEFSTTIVTREESEERRGDLRCEHSADGVNISDWANYREEAKLDEAACLSCWETARMVLDKLGFVEKADSTGLLEEVTEIFVENNQCSVCYAIPGYSCRFQDAYGHAIVWESTRVKMRYTHST